jgi:hypothetical protein
MITPVSTRAARHTLSGALLNVADDRLAQDYGRWAQHGPFIA